MTRRSPAQGRFVLLVASLFTGTLIISNIIAVKIADFSAVSGPIPDYYLPAAVVVFPLSYILGDILTEVYGYAIARRIIWAGFIANGVAVGAIAAGQALPSAPFWGNQEAYEAILGQTWRIVLASFTAYLAGEFSNAMVLSRMKLLTRGRLLWTRTIGSTVVGQGLDSVIFISIAFAGQPGIDLWPLVWKQWTFKVAFEALATPFTYLVVSALKRAEGIDVFDEGVRLNPVAVWE